MKNSNYVGIAAAGAMVVICFMPWVYIASISLVITGMDTGQTHLGKPGLLHIILSAVCVVLFSLRKVIAKRINVFIGALNMAWAIRNYLLVAQCQMGECPEKRFGIYGILFLSLILLIMTFLPKINLNNETVEEPL